MPLCLATKHTCLARLASPLLLLKIFALVAAPACGKFDTKEPQLLLTSSESISNDAGNYASPMGFGDIDWQNRSNNYSDAGVFTCKGYTPEKFIEQFSLGLDVLAMRCEGQNDEFRKKNQTPCDFRLCKQDLKPGGRTPPTVDLKIVINSPLGSIPINSSSSSGSFSGIPSSSFGGAGGFGSSSVGNIQISIGINFTLGKKPDEYTCTNPYSPEMQIEIVKAAIDFAKACQQSTK